MLIRTLSGLVGLPILIGIIYAGGSLLKISLLILSLIGLHEFYKAVNGKHLQINYIGYAFTVAYYLLLDTEKVTSLMLVFVGTILILFCYLVVTYPKFNVYNVAITFAGLMYIPILFSYVYFVRKMDNGLLIVWFIIITAFATDTFAYFSGVLLGKRKLVPLLSPNKTIEGSIGGIIGSVVVSVIYGLCVSKYFVITDVNMLVFFTMIGLTGSIFAQFGDLTASAIKRYTKIKDFGKLIPGHGGVMDRFDSVLFTAPIVYITVYLLIILS